MKTEKEDFNFYNKELKHLASKLRKEMTKAESCLWKYVLRARMMKGYPFRRQRPVLNYIADFMCKELNLIIEVDGISHDHAEQILHDKIRQQKLEKAGFTVLRFEDEDVLHHINQVKEKIEDWIEEFEERNPPF
jgi:very-short-patch-repair endonuclease